MSTGFVASGRDIYNTRLTSKRQYIVPDSTSSASAFTTRDCWPGPWPKCPRNSRLCTLLKT